MFKALGRHIFKVWETEVGIHGLGGYLATLFVPALCCFVLAVMVFFTDASHLAYDKGHLLTGFLIAAGAFPVFTFCLELVTSIGCGDDPTFFYDD